ncbi:restriction endonuclease subunit S [Micromonospora sp. RL09-050-HVF-A]|uniref:restriction endonuclease subunit S n=1 Tax=Micromonospora sp. RL09-050-HVF-A TaxID=1703433 RepID=UPI001C5F11F0|nr:restriction endonuclease subunit S [Micromonospora sp. RL09-050-HVF-A]MBW4701231.1 restriction endonuclease subunit S [Micromonospora sp. RL09-050-HVF-A]
MTTGLAGVAIPGSWEWLPLKHVAISINRGSAPDYTDDGQVWAISQAANQPEGLDWSRTRFHACNGNAAKLKGLLRPNDVLINSTGRGTLGRVGYFSGTPDSRPAMADGHVTRLRARPGVLHPRFVYHYLQSEPFQHYLYSALVVGATNQIELVGERLAAAPIPLPSLDEQRRIADFLDEQLALLDRVIALRQRQAELETERFEDFRESVVEADERAFLSPLLNLIDRARPINYGVLMPGPRLEEGIPLVEAGDVMRGPICLARLRLTDPSIEAEFKRSRLREGDLVMAIRGSVGRVQITPGGVPIVNVTRDAARISLNSKIALNAYVRHALSARRSQEWLGIRITGSAVTGINIGDLRKVPIMVPELKVQCEWASELDKAEAYLASLKYYMLQGRSLLVERKQALITAAVTGKIDVTTARRVDI